MQIGEIIAYQREQCGLSQKGLATLLSEAGVQVTNQAISKWENGSTQPNASQFLTLCRILKITNIEETFLGIRTESPLRRLNAQGREKVNEYIDLLLRSGLYNAVNSIVEPIQLRTLPLYQIPVSAGTGQFLDSDNYELTDVDDSVPLTANFGVRIAGDSMTPRFEDGQIVWVRQQQSIEHGEIGIFLYNGDAYCKQFCRDGDCVSLISLNKEYAPITITENSDFRVFGKVVG